MQLSGLQRCGSRSLLLLVHLKLRLGRDTCRLADAASLNCLAPCRLCRFFGGGNSAQGQNRLSKMRNWTRWLKKTTSRRGLWCDYLLRLSYYFGSTPPVTTVLGELLCTWVGWLVRSHVLLPREARRLLMCQSGKPVRDKGYGSQRLAAS